MNSGYKDAIIRTDNTDVVLAVAYFKDLENIGNLWIAFGTGKDFRYIPVHELARSIGPDMANGLPFNHALSDCDTTSQFANHGKKSAWATCTTWPTYTSPLVACATASTVQDHCPGLPVSKRPGTVVTWQMAVNSSPMSVRVNSVRVTVSCAVRRTTYGDRCFAVAGPRVWNQGRRRRGDRGDVSPPTEMLGGTHCILSPLKM